MVCVLGNSQKEKLIALGIPSERVTVTPNTCLLEPKLLTEKIKFHEESEQATPFRILFLSNLIPSKGFPDFLEALYILGQSTKRKIEAVLCGKLVDGKLDRRFNSVQEAEDWIEATMARINKSDSLRISWQKGADGSLKTSIFNQSHLFVFPTSYFNEAQPIVLIEALASGCGIITTNVGEITSTISGNEAMILEEPSPRYLAESIDEILGDQKLRMNQVKAGHFLFHKRFSKEKHLDNWEALFSKVIFLKQDAE
jgi:glycosyltransferase involved in cell wall biosynthesis